MISISRLLCDAINPGDSLRYSGSAGQRPVIVWNCTRQCNLRCLHCYASANGSRNHDEMDTEAGKALIQDLADFGVPVILFSGGEPLLRKDLFEMAALARTRGIRVALSTNGTLIDQGAARMIKELGFAEAGISLDGVGENNDFFRGHKGAFDAALQGIRNCIAEGVRVSLRLTITSFNYQEIPAIFRLVESEGIDRVCFYHLAYAGRGDNLQQNDISHSQTRMVVDQICQQTLDFYRRGLKKRDSDCRQPR